MTERQLLSYALDGRRMLPEEIGAKRRLVDEAERREEGRTAASIRR
jgi:hypothetical protein